MRLKDYLFVALCSVAFLGCGSSSDTPPVTHVECESGYTAVGDKCEENNTTNSLVCSNELNITDNIVDIVDAHNCYRADVFSGSLLSWDAGLAQDAQNWADYLALNYTDAIRLSGQTPHATQFRADEHEFDLFQGENIYLTSLSSDSSHMVTAIKAFGDEVVDYDYDSNTCAVDKVCGHYTQVVWKNTSTVGCAEAISQTGGVFNTITVCRYYTPGNYVGQKPY